MATWNDVQVGDWVRGGDGALWGVVLKSRIGTSDGRFILRRNGKPDFQKDVALSAQAPEIVRSADEMLATAVSAVSDVLGGNVLHVESDSESGSIYACPPEFAEPGALMAHLHILHGSTFSPDGEVTLSALEALHAVKHKAGGGTPHHHTPDYLERNRG